MKANEFVKKFGVGEARKQLKKPTGIYGAAFDYQFMDDLKRLVESHEMIKEHGSLERTQKYADSIYTAPEVKERLNQAILDVESCQ